MLSKLPVLIGIFWTIVSLGISCFPNDFSSRSLIGKEFLTPDESQYVRFIDAKKLEIKWAKDFPSEEFEYSVQGEQVRIVGARFGTKQMFYIDILEGNSIRDWNGKVYFLKGTMPTSGDTGLKQPGGDFTSPTSMPAKNQIVSGSFSEQIGNVQRAEVDIQFGAGDLTLDSLPNTSAELVQGEYEHQGLAQGVNKSFKTLDGIGRLELNTALAGQRILGDFRQKWQIGLTPRIPLDLSIKAGASQGQFNLTNLHLSRLRVDIGASKATINLPRVTSGTVDVQIKAGAADLTIRIPPGVAAQIKPDIGLASFNIDDKRFPKTGEFYVSPGFASAGGRIRLEISSGLAKIEIK